ncbi:MAG: gamma-glutamylcyclotransferase, partial [Acidimicrobiia bacterium]|nr:gamma-glutamylcyclotransferase [Acidimicrobiia bacterium]
MTVHYFAYGSNLDLEGKLRRWAPSAHLTSIGLLHDRRLAFTRRSTRWGARAADVLPTRGEHVWGALFSVEDRDIPGLDACEGAPRNYRRLGVDVETDRGTVTALTYEVVDRHLPEAAPALLYANTLLKGARAVGLPPHWIHTVTAQIAA